MSNREKPSNAIQIFLSFSYSIALIILLFPMLQIDSNERLFLYFILSITILLATPAILIMFLTTTLHYTRLKANLLVICLLLIPLILDIIYLIGLRYSENSLYYWSIIREYIFGR